MLSYIMEDGTVITAETHDAVILKIRGDIWLQEQTIKEYMLGFAERVKIVTGKEVRFDTSDNLISDLVDIGYLKIT